MFLTFKLLVALSPIFGYGWLNFFSSEGGNILISPVLGTLSSDSLVLRCIPTIFLSAFLISLPFMAKLEENIFRRGCHTLSKITVRSILFGLMHLIVGIPLGFAIALIIPGFVFADEYCASYNVFIKTMTEKESRNEAVLVSTTYHTLMNTLLLGYLIVIAIMLI